MNERQLKSMYEHECIMLKKRFKDSLSNINPDMLKVLREPFKIGNKHTHEVFYSMPIVRLTQLIEINGLEHYRALDLTKLFEQFKNRHETKDKPLTEKEKKAKKKISMQLYRLNKKLKDKGIVVLSPYNVNGCRYTHIQKPTDIKPTDDEIDINEILKNTIWVNLLSDKIAYSKKLFDEKSTYNALFSMKREITAIDLSKVKDKPAYVDKIDYKTYIESVNAEIRNSKIEQHLTIDTLKFGL